MKTQNSNYEESDDGYVRRNDAPDAKHKSRISWRRMENLQTIRSSVSELRRKQNERNEEYRRTHDD